MIPSKKNPSIDEFITSITGIDRVATIKTDTCVSCKGNAQVFDDYLSRKEYSISGLCQTCQDEIWK